MGGRQVIDHHLDNARFAYVLDGRTDASAGTPVEAGNAGNVGMCLNQGIDRLFGPVDFPLVINDVQDFNIGGNPGHVRLEHIHGRRDMGL